MKKFWCSIVCIALVFSALLLPAHANVTAEDQLLDVAMEDSRDGLAFEEGARGYYEYSFFILD